MNINKAGNHLGLFGLILLLLLSFLVRTNVLTSIWFLNKGVLQTLRETEGCGGTVSLGGSCCSNFLFTQCVAGLDPSVASLQFRKSITQYPGNFRSHLSLARTLFAHGYSKQAKESLGKYMKLEGGQDPVASLLLAAIEAFDGNSEEAANRLRDLGCSRYIAWLGDACRSIDREQSLEYYRLSMRVDPSNLEAHYGLGLICREGGNWELAQRHFEYILANGTQSWRDRVYLYLGTVYYNRGTHKKALFMFRRHIQTHSCSATAHVWLALTYAKIGQPFDSVFEQIAMAISCAPDSDWAWSVLDRLAPDEGLKMLQVLERTPLRSDQPSYTERLYIGLARLFIRRSQEVYAKKSLEMGIQTYPSSVEIRLLLACVLVQLGAVDQAVSEFQHAIELASELNRAPLTFNFSDEFESSASFSEICIRYPHLASTRELGLEFCGSLP